MRILLAQKRPVMVHIMRTLLDHKRPVCLRSYEKRSHMDLNRPLMIEIGPFSALLDLKRYHMDMKASYGSEEVSHRSKQTSNEPEQVSYRPKQASYGPEDVSFGPKKSVKWTLIIGLFIDLIRSHMGLSRPLTDQKSSHMD